MELFSITSEILVIINTFYKLYRSLFWEKRSRSQWSNWLETKIITNSKNIKRFKHFIIKGNNYRYKIVYNNHYHYHYHYFIVYRQLLYYRILDKEFRICD